MDKHSSSHLFTSSAEGQLMKIEMELFNGIFYNLDVQEDPAFVYKDINDLYEFGPKIGEGAFNIVYKARFKPLDIILAVKVLKDADNEQQC